MISPPSIATAGLTLVSSNSLICLTISESSSPALRLFSVNLHIIKYENVINNFNSTIKNTLNFLNLTWSNDVKKFYDTADKRKLISTPSYDQVNQPLYSDSVNRWKKYDNKISNILPTLEPWIKEFDYI